MYPFPLSTVGRALHRLIAFIQQTLSGKSTLFKTAAFALVYALCGHLSLVFVAIDPQLPNMWISTGLAVAILLIAGRDYWPGISLGTILGGIWCTGPTTLLLGVALGNTLGALAAVTYLQRSYHTDLRMQSFNDYLHIALAGALAASVASLAGALSVQIAAPALSAGFIYDLAHWWQGDLLGVLVISVSVLVWRTPPGIAFGRRLMSEALFFIGLTPITALAIFSDGASGWLESYLMFAFVAWGGVRFKMHGALYVITISALFGVAHLDEASPISGVLQPIQGLTNLWLFLMALAIIGTVLALSMLEKQRMESAALARSEVLQKLYQGAPLQEVLAFALHLIERSHPDLRCCMTTSSEGETTLETFCSPEFRAQTDNDALNTLVALCLTGCRKQRVIISDVSCDPDWRRHRDITTRLGIQSCYSHAIIGSNGKQLGAFSIYKRYAGRPTASERNLVARIATLLALVIEQNRLAEDLQLASLIFGNSSEAMTVTDANGIILAVNPAFTAVTGYEQAEVKGLKTSVLSSDLHDRSFYEKMWHSLQESGAWQGEIWNKKKNGELYPEWLTINTVYNSDGQPHRRVALFSDLSAQKESEKLIWQQANLDPLTNLPNRTMLYDLLNSTMCEADFSGLPVALLFIDLDRFKDVNDSLGHHQGDELLQEVAKRISHCVRQSDVVARLGGDEFTVVLKQISDTSSPERVAADIIAALSSPYTLDEGEVNYLSASIGISLYPNDAKDAETLLKNADQAMYMAKRQGRNRYQFFTPQMEDETRERIQLTSDLKTATQNQELAAYYQPIIDLQNHTIYKAELLIRWIHPQRGFVSPADFIPLAEETGIITEIGDWVFREAVQQVEQWRTRFDPRFQISVNASPIQFQDAEGTLSQWTGLMTAQGIQGDAISIEITENLMMESGDQVTAILQSFRNAGLNISLDDFGTGYSSLSYLRQLDIDFLKIDQSFVRNLSPDSSELSLCEAIIVMAHKLGIKVIAEGIETREQEQLLMQAGCDYGQGYLFSRPVPAGQFEDWYQDYEVAPEAGQVFNIDEK